MAPIQSSSRGLCTVVLLSACRCCRTRPLASARHPLEPPHAGEPEEPPLGLPAAGGELLLRGQWCYDSQDPKCGPSHWKELNAHCGGPPAARQFPMELHIVHININYRTLGEAKGHPNGLAVLGFFFTVSETDNSNYNTIVAGLRNVSHHGDSVDLASTFRLSNLLPRAGQLSKYYRYQGSLTTPDCSEVVVWTVFEEPVAISQAQLRVFVNTVHFPAVGSAPLKMTNNLETLPSVFLEVTGPEMAFAPSYPCCSLSAAVEAPYMAADPAPLAGTAGAMRR
ncbi:PREDICTED: carbonic anhydrase 15-like, partial [Tinamus guttatus]|uniref:carbonic anhydrase 15-like n=1 Tax=Tinamus guttatus TaxID=94827 RepID=UPI00052F1801